MSSGVTAHGANALSTSAAGNRNTNLFRSEPFAIFQTIGSSRSGEKPNAYPGVTAVSSTTTPTAFAPALPAAAETSSSDAAASFAIPAMSSSSATSPEATFGSRYQSAPTAAGG